jgi:hypothetical protein
LIAQRQVLLSIALRDLNGVIDVRDSHGVIGDVGHSAAATSTLQIAGEGGRDTRPDLDPGAVGGIGHGDVVDVDVLNDVDFADVLAEGADRDAVAAVAPEVLHDHVGGVGLEGYAVVAVVNVGVLDYDVGAAVGVPSARTCQLSLPERRGGVLAYPSVFFAGLALLLVPSIVMLVKTTSVEFATRLYHCGLYLMLMSAMDPPLRPMVPNRIGRRM